jgi:hypothetical protein
MQRPSSHKLQGVGLVFLLLVAGEFGKAQRQIFAVLYMFLFLFATVVWTYNIVDIIRKRKVKQDRKKPLIEDVPMLLALVSILSLLIIGVLDSILQVVYGQSNFVAYKGFIITHIVPICGSAFFMISALMSNSRRKEWASKLKSSEIDKSRVKRHIIRLWFGFVFLVIAAIVCIMLVVSQYVHQLQPL